MLAEALDGDLIVVSKRGGEIYKQELFLAEMTPPTKAAAGGEPCRKQCSLNRLERLISAAIGIDNIIITFIFITVIFIIIIFIHHPIADWPFSIQLIGDATTRS